MPKKMLIDATHAEETRVVVADGTRVDEFDFETVNKRQLAGNIYLAKVTRVEPSLQAAFVDYGGNRHGFLAFSEIHPDYYQIPVADREALLAEERAYAAQQAAEEEGEKKPRRRRSKASRAKDADPVAASDVPKDGASGMDVVELDPPVAEADALPIADLPEIVSDAVDDHAEAAVEASEATAPDPAPERAVPPDAAEALAAEADGGVVPEPDAGPDAAPIAAAADAAPAAVASGERSDDAEEGEAPYAAVDHATEIDADIESVADEDVTEEIRQPRKARPRRYKIQEVVKVRQIMLVQVVKEERGNKGAALTTYLSLAGRYCVLMPNTARGGGISRKITNATDRKKLKDIAGEIEVPEGAGLIIRTAGAKRTKTEIKRDYEYLKRLWEQIRDLTLKSIAPAPIYEEGNLIKRSIRDLYARDIEEVLVEGEAGYRVAKDFMKMIMPSHAKNVKHYQEIQPLFARHQVESYLSSMFNPTVQLKSGGYIVIGVTEALVAIDVNSGRATKKGSIEETALETNLEAAEEIARQLRLRDLAGLIVIDFIDMEERKNNSAVEKRFKEKLKTDRARIQVGRISGFGLLEMSRQRLRPGMLEATTQPCPHCHGTGLIRSDDSIGLQILRQLEEEGGRRRSREVLVICPTGIGNFLMNKKREHIAQIEGRYGLSVRIETDGRMISPEYSIEKFKTATRAVPEPTAPVISIDTSDMPEMEAEAEEAVEAATEAVETSDDTGQPKKKRRRRRRRRGSGGGAQEGQEAAETGADGQEQPEETSESAEPAVGDDRADAAAEAPAQEEDEAAPEKPAKRSRVRRTSRSRKSKVDAAADADASSASAEASDAASTETGVATEPVDTSAAVQEPDVNASPEAAAPEHPVADPAPEPPATEAAEPEPPAAEAAELEPDVAEAAETERDAAPQAEASQELPSDPEPKTEPEPEPEPALVSADPGPAPEPSKPKRRGWWSIGR
ncbi:MAG: ribonuclease E/G [Pseudomonadota bacterium]